MRQSSPWTRTDPSELSPNQILAELAAILATGLSRLRKSRRKLGTLDESARKTAAETAAERLDLPAETVLSVHDG